MGNLMSIRGGFLGHPISGGATQPEKDSFAPGRLRETAVPDFARVIAIVSSYNITIYRLDISRQGFRVRGRIIAWIGLKSSASVENVPTDLSSEVANLGRDESVDS